MNYRKTLVLGLAAFLIIGIPLGVLASDTSARARKIVSVPAGEIVEGDFFAAGERVEISGTVKGDLYAAGAEVIIDGTVEGDVLSAGGSVRISGTVGDDVRAAGGQIKVSGQIGGNATVVGGEIEFDEGAEMDGNIVAAGGNIIVASAVSGDIKAAGGTMTISGVVGGTVTGHIDTLRLTSKASIGKNLTYWSPRTASIDESAQVVGTVEYNEVARKQGSEKKIAGILAGVGLITSLISFGAFLIIGLLIVRYLPTFAERTRSMVVAQPWSTLGIGTAVTFLVPLAAILAMITLVGLPIGLIALALYFPLMYLGKFPAIFAIGRLIVKDAKPGWAVAVGTAIYYILVLIPFVGGIAAFAISLIGLGAWIKTKQQLWQELKTHGKL